jgi:hypothetical protein
MADSVIEICNLALAKIGHEPRINDLNENTKGARLCSTFYNPCRRALLREFLWRFARKKAVLAPLSETPAFDGGKMFQLPADCLRVIGTDDDYKYGYGRWYVEQDKIIADTDVLNIVYIADIENPAYFDPIFDQALACRLAIDLSIPITQSGTRRSEMVDEYRAHRTHAAFVSATEVDSQKFISETFIQRHF